MVLYIFSIFMFLFVSFSLFFRSGAPVWIKALGTLIIFAASMKYVIYQLVGGAFFSPALPRSLILFLEALYGALFLLFFLLILWDFYLGLNWLLGKTGVPTPERLPKGWIKGALCCFSLAGGIWGVWETVRVPAVKEIPLYIKNMPCELNDIKIVQLTDLHIGPLLKRAWLEKVVEKVNALEPDLILLTGDYVDGHVDVIGDELLPLASLRSRYGIYAVSGNHEYYWNITEWESALENLNIKWLNNSHEAINITGAEALPIVVAGIPDMNAERFGFEGPDLSRALRNAPDGLRILLAHQPRDAVKNLEDFDLQLSGHTHGGTMFFLQPLITRFNNGFVKGLYELASGSLYVSPGTGIWNGFSCRIGVPAEITCFILHCGSRPAEKPAE